MVTGFHFETWRAIVRRVTCGFAAGLVLSLWSSVVLGAADEGVGNGNDAEIGILGTVTQVDGLEVNGRSIMPAPEASISVEGETVSADDLKVGHVVTIEAREADGTWLADRITIRHAVAGSRSRSGACRCWVKR